MTDEPTAYTIEVHEPAVYFFTGLRKDRNEPFMNLARLDSPSASGLDGLNERDRVVAIALLKHSIKLLEEKT